MDEIEKLTIMLTNTRKHNATRDEISLPTNTNVKIDLQSNNDAVIIFLFCRNVQI